MYTELNSLLEQNVIDDAWYDDGFLVAQDIMNNFVAEDWKRLGEEVLSKDIEWQKKLAYCIDNQLIEEELNIICKLLQVKNDELLEMCVDSLRSFDNEVGHLYIKNNPQIIQMVKSRIKNAGTIEKIILEKFLSIFDENVKWLK